MLIYTLIDLEKKKARHTLQDKRKMRNERKRRKRQLRNLERYQLLQYLQEEKKRYKKEVVKNVVAKNMIKTFWERWRHELEERKVLQKRERELIFSFRHSIIPKCDVTSTVPRVDRSLLINPTKSGENPDFYVGRGSFGIVKCQMYRGICVAVKEFLPHTIEESVLREAQIMSKLCHPYLPLLFGVCTAKRPYILVAQYYGIGFESVTLFKELQKHTLAFQNETWFVLCAQVIEALFYLHREVHIIHNDLKADNVLLTNLEQFSKKSALTSGFQVIVTDFGKATYKDSGRKYCLSSSEKQQYRFYHRHIAPEIIDGLEKQNVRSDKYSLGKLLQNVFTSAVVPSKTEVSIKLQEAILKCVDKEPCKRPSISDLHTLFEKTLKLL